MSRRFDAIIIGAGQAGPALAERLGKAGMRVAVVERHLVGGTCVNTGCIPTKTMVASAYAARIAGRAADYGVGIAGPVSVDMAAVRARKDRVSGNSRSNVENWLAGMDNVTLIRGHARFQSPGELRVGEEVLGADRFFLNVGGRPNIPDMPGIGEIDYLTNRTVMELDRLPRHLLVVGGSYIGLEFAQMFRRFGSEVTVIEMGPRLIGREDGDVSAAIREILEDEGITVRTNAQCISFARHDEGISVGVNCEADPAPSIGSHVLLAVGRRPNTDDLGLDKAGVEMDARGYVKVDDQLCTTVPHIWAMGDCNGKGAFTHTAYNDYEIVAANLLDNDPRRLSDRITSYGLFVDPPLGRAGMTEADLAKSGRRVLVGRRPMSRVGRAIEKGETQGFMKIAVDADSREILGAAILGPGGDEAIHAILAMMHARAPYDVLQRSVHIHPTVAELIPTILGGLKPL